MLFEPYVPAPICSSIGLQLYCGLQNSDLHGVTKNGVPKSLPHDSIVFLLFCSIGFSVEHFGSKKFAGSPPEILKEKELWGLGHPVAWKKTKVECDSKRLFGYQPLGANAETNHHRDVKTCFPFGSWVSESTMPWRRCLIRRGHFHLEAWERTGYLEMAVSSLPFPLILPQMLSTTSPSSCGTFGTWHTTKKCRFAFSFQLCPELFKMAFLVLREVQDYGCHGSNFFLERGKVTKLNSFIFFHFHAIMGISHDNNWDSFMDFSFKKMPPDHPFLGY